MTDIDPDKSTEPVPDEVIRPPAPRNPDLASAPSATLEGFLREFPTPLRGREPLSPDPDTTPAAEPAQASAETIGEKDPAIIAGHFAPLERSDDEANDTLRPDRSGAPTPAEGALAWAATAWDRTKQFGLLLSRRTDVVIPVLATLVGLIALLGAVMVDRNSAARVNRLSGELAEIRSSINALANRAQAQLRTMPDPAVLAERQRLAAELAEVDQRLMGLELQINELGATVAALPAAAVAAAAGSATPAGGADVAGLDGPTEDCIPLQTRFMVTAGDTYPICRTPAVIKVVDVTADSVLLEDVGPVTAGGFTRIGVANCTAMVFSAGVEGFAEMRIGC